MSTNPQLDLAFNFVTYTNKNIFLTGKAGTGKTTFLHNLKKSSPKRMVIVAPTGVAAINAGGVTIHSFFQMAFGPFVPENQDSSNAQFKQKFNRDKINLILSLDLLVIDEISMVRADTLDCIDEILRRYKDRNQPFGGVQLLMIGDLHQLSPVVKEDDWKILRDYYPNLFFFNSNALLKTSPISIELKHIYRQTDNHFIDLLNSVRQNKIDSDILKELNKRYIPNFKPNDDEGYITLTTHNQSAQQINEVKLTEIKEKAYNFTANVVDDFPEYAYPTDFKLELKIGAQVMFVKNDPSRDRLYYNGKIGKITKIDQDTIFVKCPGEFFEIEVHPVDWTNIKYSLNPETKEVEGKIIGSFTQYPLKLAWAITIHKSQGLTFEKAIIDANAAFAHGQVYVALSRCKSFEGMVLKTPISFNSVKTDGVVVDYTKKADENAPGEKQLIDSKIAFQQSLIFNLFDFSDIKTRFFYINKIAEDHNNTLPPALIDNLAQIKALAEKEIYDVADSFKKQLSNLFCLALLPEDNAELQDRIKKGCQYFFEKTESLIELPAKNLNVETDNKSVRASINDALGNLQKAAFVKIAAMRLCLNGFKTLEYLQIAANAEIDYAATQKQKTISQPALGGNIKHPDLYVTLKNWRDSLAEENNTPVYIVLPQKALLDLIHQLPSTRQELEAIKGIGKIKVKQYGNDILTMINEYCDVNNIERSAMIISLKDVKTKIDTKKVSFDLYKAGKTIIEIAEERSLTSNTIEGHLAHYINTGEIVVFDIVSKIKVAKIMAHIIQNPNLSNSERKLALGDEVSYGDLKAVMNHLDFIQAGN